MIFNKLLELKDSQSTAIIYDDKSYSYSDFFIQINATIDYLSIIERAGNGQLCVVSIQNFHLCWLTILALRFRGYSTLYVESIEQMEKLELRNIAHIFILESELERHLSVRELQNKYKSNYIIVPDRIYFERDSYCHLSVSNSNIPTQSGHILYTSGTTGTYKKVFIDVKSEQFFSARLKIAYELSTDTKFNNVLLPLYTTAGYRIPLAVWNFAGCVIFNKNKSEIVDIFAHGSNLVFLTPFLVSEFIKAGSEYDSNRNSDFKVSIGGGFLSEELAKKVVERLSAHLKIIYGSTETSARLYSEYTSSEDLMWLKTPENNRFYIFNSEFKECNIDEEGELAIKIAENDPYEYLDDEESSSKTFRDGYFFPGDRAVKRGDGKIRILGRTQDVINIMGDKYNVTPIEKNILDFVGASNVCIFSTFTDSGKNKVIVAVETDKGVLPSQIQTIENYLDRFDEVEIKTVSKFPTTLGAMTKIDRTALRNFLLLN